MNIRSNDVTVRLGTGDGGFGAMKQWGVGLGPLFVRAGDMDLDGVLDLVATNSVDDDVSILIGVGDGGFEPQLRVPFGDVLTDLALVDLNSDGKPDLVVVNIATDEVTVLLNACEDGCAADIDGDGDIDAEDFFAYLDLFVQPC